MDSLIVFLFLFFYNSVHTRLFSPVLIVSFLASLFRIKKTAYLAPAMQIWHAFNFASLPGICDLGAAVRGPTGAAAARV